MVDSVVPVARFFAVTLARGTTAPAESVTRPLIPPLPPCARTAKQAHTEKRRRQITLRTHGDYCLPPDCMEPPKQEVQIGTTLHISDLNEHNLAVNRLVRSTIFGKLPILRRQGSPPAGPCGRRFRAIQCVRMRDRGGGPFHRHRFRRTGLWSTHDKRAGLVKTCPSYLYSGYSKSVEADPAVVHGRHQL